MPTDSIISGGSWTETCKLPVLYKRKKRRVLHSTAALCRVKRIDESDKSSGAGCCLYRIICSWRIVVPSKSRPGGQQRWGAHSWIWGCSNAFSLVSGASSSREEHPSFSDKLGASSIHGAVYHVWLKTLPHLQTLLSWKQGWSRAADPQHWSYWKIGENTIMLL